MNLQILKEGIVSFKKYLQSPSSSEELYKWESLYHFQNNWDLEQPSFEEMYEQSLQNSTTKRLWKSENYVPKKMMKLLIQLNADYVKFMFKDLFDETKEAADRVDRFIFYCDDLLSEYKKQYPLSIDNNHYQDHRMISMYLAFRYPERYTFYDFPSFRTSMTKLGSAKIPTVDDLERFFKVSQTIWKFLEKEEEVWALHEKRLIGKHLYRGKSLLLVHEFYKQL